MTRSVLVSGAGIAGPALAYWLTRYGDRVTVVERAPGLRAGGAAVDFRGDQLALVERMGVLDAIRAHATDMGDLQVVDAAGRPVSRLPSAVFSGELEVERGDLARVLYEHSGPETEYVFGDHITALTERPDGVEVAFASGGSRAYDLVVGADGLHSGVRRFAFGAEEGFRTDLGYYTAGFSVPNTFGLDHSGVIYNEPGRYVCVSSARDATRAMANVVFSAAMQDHDRHDADAQRRIVARHFADVGWRMPEILAAMPDAPDLYFDSLSQVRLDRWSTGRVALLGDAAWCAGPGGNGTGHALLGAYTLAGELALAGPDHRLGFARYEQLMRPTVTKSQKFASKAGRYLAPPTEGRIRRRDRTYRMLSTRLMTGVLTWLTTRTAKTGELKDYPLLAPVRA